MTTPMKIRLSSKDGFTDVKVAIKHPMATGQRRDAKGKPLPALFINELLVKLNDKVLLQSEFGSAIAKNPNLSFRFKGGVAGDRLTVSWTDSKGDSRSDEVLIT